MSRNLTLKNLVNCKKWLHMTCLLLPFESFLFFSIVLQLDFTFWCVSDQQCVGSSPSLDCCVVNFCWTLKICSFIKKEQCLKYLSKSTGRMYRALRSGKIRKPDKMTDVSVPLQKTFKNAKWWGKEPSSGRQLVPARQRDLKEHFKKQIKQIWEVSQTLSQVYP